MFGTSKPFCPERKVRIRRFSFSLLGSTCLAVLFAITSVARAADANISSLKDIHSVWVSVNDISGDGNTQGALSVGAIQAIAEKTLRTSGIQLATKSEFIKQGNPFPIAQITIHISALRAKTDDGVELGRAYGIIIECSQACTVIHNFISLDAVTWHREQVGTIPTPDLTKQVLEGVEQYITEFANDFAKANK